MSDLNLHLVDSDPEVCANLRESFRNCLEVSIQTANILDVATNCVVSPANSYGYMDGGIDNAYRKFFGSSFETKIMEKINSLPEGRLNVGAAIVVATGNNRIPFAIIAPTMIMPEFCDSSISKRALSAILRAYDNNKKNISEIYCPGLGTGVGSVPPIEAANSMAEAYLSWRNQQLANAQDNWVEIVLPKNREIAAMEFEIWRIEYESKHGRIEADAIRIDTIRCEDKSTKTRYMVKRNLVENLNSQSLRNGMEDV